MAEALADGNVAIALLGNTIPTGAILVVLITMLGPISGAHFNPAVTMVFAIRGAVTTGQAAGYVVAQIVGGLLGVWAAHMMFDLEVLQVSQTTRTGSAQWFAEAVATFGLLFTILATLRANERAVAMAVGLYITAAYWFTASTSFANPAVTIGRGFTDSFSGIRPQDVIPFVIAQLVGAFLAHLFCRWLVEPEPDGATQHH